MKSTLPQGLVLAENGKCLACHAIMLSLLFTRQRCIQRTSFPPLKKEMYLKSYRHVFNPMPAEHGWTKTETDDIMPPAFKDHLKGRRQEKRRRGKFEPHKPKETSRMATITCGNYKKQGHKYTSCSEPLRPDLAMRKSNHKVNLLL
jgi:hypothetical protein